MAGITVFGGEYPTEGVHSVTVPAVPTGSYGNTFKAWLPGGHSDGIAGYFEGFVSASPDGHCYGVGAWLSISGGATVALGANTFRALDVGFYDGGALASTSATITGIHVYTHVSSTLDPSIHTMMSFNTNTGAGTDPPDAWFIAANDAAVAYVSGGGQTSVASGHIAVIVGGAIVRYIRLYPDMA